MPINQRIAKYVINNVAINVAAYGMANVPLLGSFKKNLLFQAQHHQGLLEYKA